MGLLWSCSSDDVTNPDEMDDLKESAMYLSSRNEMKKRMVNLERKIQSAVATRNLESCLDNDLVSFVTTLSSDELSEMIKIFKVDELVEKYDSAIQCVLLEIERETSSEELAKCLNFIHSYIEREGHVSINEFGNLNITSNILIQYTIAALGAYDEITSYFEKFQQTRGSYEYCLLQLRRQMTQSFVSGVAADAVIESLALCPVVDVLAVLLDAGYDFVSALNMANEFNKCLY